MACSINGCECIGKLSAAGTRYYPQGFCNRHYIIKRKYGDPLYPVKRRQPVGKELRKHSLYTTWLGMKERCYYVKNISYPRYGAKGIRVCEEWKHNFLAFAEYMGPKPTPEHTLDRINNLKGYEPGNVRWSDKKDQAVHRNTTRLITYNGEKLCIADWAERLNIKRTTLAHRLNNGWSVERALNTRSQ